MFINDNWWRVGVMKVIAVQEDDSKFWYKLSEHEVDGGTLYIHDTHQGSAITFVPNKIYVPLSGPTVIL